MKRKLTMIVAAAPLATVLIAVGCGSSQGYSAGPDSAGAPYAAADAAKVAVTKTGIGRVVVDGGGRTVYVFEGDTDSRSSCYGACAQEWPPLLTQGTPLAGSGAKQSLLGTTRRRDGAEQVTYTGRPLYRFVDDRKAGDTEGEGVQDFGAGWEAVSGAGGKIDADGS